MNTPPPVSDRWRTAAALARDGWPILPLWPWEKVPHSLLAPHGLLDASTSLATIDRWAWAAPNGNYGVRCGGDRGLLVVDVDGPEGSAALWKLERQHGALPATFTVATPGGSHRWYTYPEHLPNSAGKLGPNIDTRGEGGYVVGPGSQRRDGRYAIATSAPVAVLPEWIAEALRPPPPLARPAGESVLRRGTSRGYADAALDYEAAAVRQAPVGQRNHTLFKSAAAIGELVGAGLIEDWRAAQGLLSAATAAGLGDHEARATILSGLNRGAASPRQVAS